MESGLGRRFEYRLEATVTSADRPPYRPLSTPSLLLLLTLDP